MTYLKGSAKFHNAKQNNPPKIIPMQTSSIALKVPPKYLDSIHKFYKREDK